MDQPLSIVFISVGSESIYKEVVTLYSYIGEVFVSYKKESKQIMNLSNRQLITDSLIVSALQKMFFSYI